MPLSPTTRRAVRAASFWVVAASVGVLGCGGIAIGLTGVFESVAPVGGDALTTPLSGADLDRLARLHAAVATVLFGIVSTAVLGGLLFAGGSVSRLRVRRVRIACATLVVALAVAVGPLLAGLDAVRGGPSFTELVSHAPDSPRRPTVVTPEAVRDSVAHLLNTRYLEADVPQPSPRSSTPTVYPRMRGDDAAHAYADLRYQSMAGRRLTIPTLADVFARHAPLSRPYRSPVLDAVPADASSTPQIVFATDLDVAPRLRRVLSTFARRFASASWLTLLDAVQPRHTIVLLDLQRPTPWLLLFEASPSQASVTSARERVHAAANRLFPLDDARAFQLDRSAIRRVRFDRIDAPSDSTLRVRAHLQGAGLLPDRSSAALTLTLTSPSFWITSPR